ncbi:MAG TPA: M3 family metallopeptidase, partial [Coxiellaceae bacterium]|nr:M3 family metallopeptidase [Coxiellaceae bacterium]
PSYIAVMTHAESGDFREAMYHAYVTRASDQGPKAQEWNNSDVMVKILQARTELAQLLGFHNYAEKSLATKMVKKTSDVLAFLEALGAHSKEKAREEFKSLSHYAKTKWSVHELKPWDIAYYSEKLRQEQYNISQETLRPYFPEPRVLEGLFLITEKLFGVKIERVEHFDSWDKHVKLFSILHHDGSIRAQFYMDLYARKHKRGGAWMDECRVRRQLPNGKIQIPVAYVTCNFNASVGKDPALFTHDEVETLFHEFGHALQHMLTTVNYSEVSGINGIPWDAVEVASQCNENWAWEKEGLHFIATHYKTEEPLPDSLYESMIAAKNFQSAMQMVRQLEFSLFDFHLHMKTDVHESKQIQHVLDAVRKEVSVVPVPSYHRFQHSFGHIFAGGYAAGYYSYKWAEVMAADAFSLFKERGIFDHETAQRYLTFILEPGGSREFDGLFREFRGRDPDIKALLEQTGITA